MRYFQSAVLAAFMLCQSLAAGGESDSKAVTTVVGRDGVHRLAILGTVVGHDEQLAQVAIPDGYPRGPLIEDEESERLGVAVEETPQPTLATEQAADPTGKIRLLRGKLARYQNLEQEMASLYAEIAELRKATGTPAEITLNAEIIEVSLTKLRALGIEFPKAPGDQIAADSLRAIGDAAARPQTAYDCVEFLKRKNVAVTLGRPQLRLLDGSALGPARNAFSRAFVGKLIPVPNPVGDKSPPKNEPVGASVEATAEALGNNRVRLKLKLQAKELDEARSVMSRGQWVPAFQVQQCLFQSEVAFGETIVVAGPVVKRTESCMQNGREVQKDNEIETWLVIRAEAASVETGQEQAVRAAAYEAPPK